jgi:tRNA A37 threonylcarbamoyladenosine modification protein TsaB
MVALLPAGRGRYAAAWYKWSKRKWNVDGSVRVLDGPALLQAIDRPTYVCGEMDAETRHALAAGGRVDLAPPELCLRRPAVLAQIGWDRLRTRKASDPLAVVPVYPETAESARR